LIDKPKSVIQFPMYLKSLAGSTGRWPRPSLYREPRFACTAQLRWFRSAHASGNLASLSRADHVTADTQYL